MSKRGDTYHKTDGKCAYCGGKLEPFGTWHIDHAKPRKQGGSNEFDNLWPACANCNGQKKGKTAPEFQCWIVSSSIELLQRVIKRLSCARSVLNSGDAEISEELREAIMNVISDLEESQAHFYTDTITLSS